MLMIIFIIVFGYTILSNAAWDDHDVDYYKEADYSNGSEILEELEKATLTSKEDAEKFIEYYEAFLESPYASLNSFYIQDQLSDKAAEADDIVDGRKEPEGTGDLPSGNAQSWISYDNKIADASTDEEWREIYEAFANPIPGTGKGEMINDMAEKYIRLVGQILGSGSFQNWARVNEPNAQRTLELRMQELVENGYDIQDEEAQDIIERYGADVDANGAPIDTNSPIYQYPQKTSQNDNSEESLEDVIADGDAFLEKGNININQTALQNFSKTMYNILLAIGVVVAVIIGALIGLKLMTASVEEKAEAKKLIIPYIVGCFIVFGGFGIWKIVITILQGI